MTALHRAARLQHSLRRTATLLARHRLVVGVVVFVLCLLFLALDYASPPYMEYSVVYAILIAFATQFAAWQLGIVLAVSVPITHLVAYFLAPIPPYPLAAEIVNVSLLFFVGIGTVYLLRTVKAMEELRQENIRLETLQQTMITVNDIVLNRLQVMQFMMHLTTQGKPLTPEQVQLGKTALDDIAARLHELSRVNRYETTEITAGVRAVQVPAGPKGSGPMAPLPANTTLPTAPPPGPAR
jgi:hypothetical protein